MQEGKSCIQDLCALKSKFLSQVFSDFWGLWASQKIKLRALEVPQRLSTCALVEDSSLFPSMHMDSTTIGTVIEGLDSLFWLS